MKRIVGIYSSKQQADRVLEALEDMGFDRDALSTFARSRVEVEDVESKASGEADGDAAQEIMVIAYVHQDQQNQVETIFKNSGAAQVNAWGEDWQPATTWSPIVFARMTNPQ